MGSPVGMGPWRADPTRWYTPGACGPETRAGVSSRKGGRSSVQTTGAGREEGPGSSYGSAQAPNAPPRPLFRETRPPQGRHIDPLKDPQSEAARTDANNLKTPMAKKPQLKSTSEEDNRAANCGLQRTRL